MLQRYKLFEPDEQEKLGNSPFKQVRMIWHKLTDRLTGILLAVVDDIWKKIPSGRRKRA